MMKKTNISDISLYLYLYSMSNVSSHSSGSHKQEHTIIHIKMYIQTQPDFRMDNVNVDHDHE